MKKYKHYSPEFDQLFTLANYASLTPEERDMYNSSLKRKWDNKNVLDYAVKKGLEQGLEQGREQGLEQGREQGIHKKAIEIALEMLVNKYPIEEIIKLTKLSKEEIQSLQK
ncbi:putative transposase/invertase (TIGR01784 family) [Pedobacter sp. AK017]|uniref:PD-(D/E)XK nuclease family transposase n=1 Tax=Pedobacter sp. AK017 TaxID=2723073 RepID=UPI001851C22D|nr:PD-(D/E)XK nuclease family transposase [Pedobacter sp. AK017]MBB5436521.1 putative transposase/invertase (TIGR01784 family) [Pedobacter sp. AK017]